MFVFIPEVYFSDKIDVRRATVAIKSHAHEGERMRVDSCVKDKKENTSIWSDLKEILKNLVKKLFK